MIATNLLKARNERPRQLPDSPRLNRIVTRSRRLLRRGPTVVGGSWESRHQLMVWCCTFLLCFTLKLLVVEYAKIVIQAGAHKEPGGGSDYIWETGGVF